MSTEQSRSVGVAVRLLDTAAEGEEIADARGRADGSADGRRTSPILADKSIAYAGGGIRFAVRPVGPRWIKLKIKPESVRSARDFAASVLNEAAVTDHGHRESVALAVSELATNALRAAAGFRAWSSYDTPVHVGVAVRPRWTHLLIVDPNPALPERRGRHDLLDEAGRGLAIVQDLAAMPLWIVQSKHCKTVHAVIAQPGVTLTTQEQDALMRRAIL